jgi:transposase
MIRILSKSIINKFILPYLSKALRGYASKVPLWEIVNAILYKFKTGIQWHFLPIKSLINRRKIKYGAIYHHYRKWSKDGSWQRAFEQLLSKHKAHLDLSLAFLDATHSIAKRGGDEVGNYGKRKIKSTNTLWLTDRQGLVVAFCPPISGTRHDAFDIKKRFREMLNFFHNAQIELKGLWLNADKAFECEALRQVCNQFEIELNAPHNRRRAKDLEDDLPYFDELMFEERYKIERTNAWMDNNRSFVLRFDKSITSWYAWHYIFCIIQWIDKVLKV